jgi:hypothetical protein
MEGQPGSTNNWIITLGRWTILLSMLGTAILVEIFLIAIIIEAQHALDSTVLRVLLAFFAVVLSLGIWRITFFTFWSIVVEMLPYHCAWPIELLNGLNERSTRAAAITLFGLDPASLDVEIAEEPRVEDEEEDELMARLQWLEKAMQHSQQLVTEQVQSSEERLSQQIKDLQPGKQT